MKTNYFNITGTVFEAETVRKQSSQTINNLDEILKDFKSAKELNYKKILSYLFLIT